VPGLQPRKFTILIASTLIYLAQRSKGRRDIG
jgi:hypothetical protein